MSVKSIYLHRFISNKQINYDDEYQKFKVKL